MSRTKPMRRKLTIGNSKMKRTGSLKKQEKSSKTRIHNEEEKVSRKPAINHEDHRRFGGHCERNRFKDNHANSALLATLYDRDQVCQRINAKDQKANAFDANILKRWQQCGVPLQALALIRLSFERVELRGYPRLMSCRSSESLWLLRDIKGRIVLEYDRRGCEYQNLLPLLHQDHDEMELESRY